MKRPSYRKARRILAAAPLCLALLASPTLASNTETRLSPAEARSFAIGLLRDSQPAAARAIALGLLKKDSRDYVALMVLADAERRLGRMEKAKFAARRAWRSTDSEQEKFSAAYLMSSILKTEEKYNQSQFWLRRAGQATDDARLEHAAHTEFRRVRALNPWTVNFGLTFTPTSNVNGGPNDNTYTIGDLVFVDETAIPLSGFEVGAQLGVTRRFAPQDWGQVSFSVKYDERRYILSDKAQAAVPTAKASDYAFTALDANLSLDFAGGRENAQSGVDVSFGRNWLDQDALASYYELRYARSSRLSDTQMLGYGASYENKTRHDNSMRSTQTYTLDGFWLKKLAKGDYVRLGVELAKADSESSEMAHTAASLTLAYLPNKPVLKSRLTLSALLQARDYDRLRYGTSRRSDTKLSLAANFHFTEIDYMGFSPSLTVRATRNVSNITLFDNQEFGISFGVKSNF